jgi:hypothetical protein
VVVAGLIGHSLAPAEHLAHGCMDGAGRVKLRRQWVLGQLARPVARQSPRWPQPPLAALAIAGSEARSP